MKQIFTGVAALKSVNAGSKSANEEVVLQSDAGPVLRLAVDEINNPFDFTALKPLVGQRVSVEGEQGQGSRYSQYIFVDKIADIKPLAPPKP